MAVILVTGATDGLGRLVAADLAERGHEVLVHGRDRARVDAVADEIGAAGSHLADFSSLDDVRALAGSLDELDVLVNNAGLMLLGEVDGADTDDWRRMIDANLLGLMYMTHAALPHLLRRRGTIVQMSSIAGRVARAGNGVYAATKFGVNAFSESLRQEVAAEGVRVVVVEPGVVDTELRTHITQQAARERIEASAAAMRQLQPEDIAAAVLYAITQPEHVSVNELFLRPTDQSW